MLMYVVVVMLIGAGMLFMWKKPLRLDGARAALGPPLACRSCGSFLASHAGLDAIVRCADCGTYARVGVASTLVPIAPDHVAASHVFHAYLPEAPRWPASCCLCGAPATRTEPMKITYAAEPTFEERMTAKAVVGLASLGTVGIKDHHINVTERFAVPHCEQHAGGATLVPAGVAFRSYAYYQQFVAANRANVGG